MRIFVFLLAMIALPCLAATEETVTPGVWNGYSASTIVTRDHPTEAACVSALQARGAGTYRCRTDSKVVVVVVPDPPPVTETWTHCAGEGELCGYTGTRKVRLGVDTRWRILEQPAVDGGVMCRNSVFGGDPAPGVVKTCQLSSVVAPLPPTPDPTPAPPAVGTATVPWIAPTLYTDGTPITNLAGFRIHYGLSATAMTQTVQVADPRATSHRIENLAPGTWYFAIRAYTSGGTESALSNVVSKVVQ